MHVHAYAGIAHAHDARHARVDCSKRNQSTTCFGDLNKFSTFEGSREGLTGVGVSSRLLQVEGEGPARERKTVTYSDEIRIVEERSEGGAPQYRIHTRKDNGEFSPCQFVGDRVFEFPWEAAAGQPYVSPEELLWDYIEYSQKGITNAVTRESDEGVFRVKLSCNAYTSTTLKRALKYCREVNEELTRKALISYMFVNLYKELLKQVERREQERDETYERELLKTVRDEIAG